MVRMLVPEWLADASTSLSTAGVEAASLEAQIFAAHALETTRSLLLAHPEWEVPKEADALLARRLASEPLAYILGYREFYGRRFKVGPGVLIPRQETETLVEAVLGSEMSGSSKRVLDLGTGSGCIGITLQLEAPRISVTLADISEAALKIATANAALLLADVETVVSDCFQNLVGRSFDIIVSNPPYVRVSDPLPPEIRNFEPREALYAGVSGLEFYARLSVEATEFLSNGGRLFLEVGDNQASAVRALFVDQGWTVSGTHRDLLGFERVLELRSSAK
jgi:release factor glutamine methyltransferase